MIRAADVLRTLEDLAVVYDAHGYPTVGASVRSFRSSISHEIHKAITAEETP